MTSEKKPDETDALFDPDLPPTEEEKIASARLRDALENPAAPDDDADFLRALSLAHEPRPLPEAEHRVIIERAVAKQKPRGRVVRVVFGVGTALALAAAAILVVGRVGMQSARTADMSARVPMQAPALVQARSTQDLFEEPFAKPLSREARGATTARIDRIAMARAGDLRENRFAMWGVR